jgi:hypothetical protein
MAHVIKAVIFYNGCPITQADLLRFLLDRKAATSVSEKEAYMNKFNYRWIALALSLMLMAALGAGVMAQEAPTTVDPIVVGDADAESLAIVQQYLATRDPNLLAEDVQYFEPGTAGPISGRDFIAQNQGLFYGQGFTESAALPILYIVADEGFVIVEFEYTGTNTGAFAEQPATNIDVLIPMIGVYQVQTGQIVRASVYYDSNQLYTQLGYGFTPGVGIPMTDPAFGPMVDGQPLPNFVGDILNDPTPFYGQRVVVDGNVGRSVDADSFVLYENQFLAPNYEVLVITQTEEAEDFIQLADSRVRVEGTVYQLGSQEMTTAFGRQVDQNLFADFEGDTVILADSVVNIEVVQTIGHIVDTPEAFHGQQVTVNGLVGDPVGAQAFALYQPQLIGIRGQVLVIDATGQQMDYAAMRDQELRVLGTVYSGAADGELITTETGLNFADPAFNEYRDWPVIVAQEIVPVTFP